MNPRAGRVLATAREIRDPLVESLDGIPDLDEGTVRRARRIIRTYAVQAASMDQSAWMRGYAAIRVGTAVMLVVVPVAVLAPLYPTVSGASQLVAGAVYICLLVALASGWRYRHGTVVWPRTVLVWCLLLLLLGVVDALGPDSWRPREWGGLLLAALGAAMVLALVAARFATVVWLRDRYFRPLAFRVGGGPLPAHLATVWLIILVSSLHEARLSWWRPRGRERLLRWMRALRFSAERQLLGSARDAGLGAAAEADAERRARHFGDVLRRVEGRLLDADAAADYAAIVGELVTAFEAVTRGDWASLTLAEEPAVRARRWRGLLRRAVPAVVLAAAALFLPLLPGHPATTDASVATVRLGLLVAALLSLMPVEADVRSRVITAYTATNRTE